MSAAVESLASGEIDAPLTASEQNEIARQLGPLMIGVGLLALGAIYSWLVPDQREVAKCLQALAALIVAVPILRKGVRGFLTSPPTLLTEQLVSLAILAAMASGDFITATLVPLFLELGHLFEERSSRGARAAIEGIRKLHATRATIKDKQGEREVEPASLRVGDHVIVRPGEVIPVDGQIQVGHSSVDQAPITGESVYEDVSPGDDVFSGTINLGGLLVIETTRVASDSVLGRVLSLLRKVEASKTSVIRLLERYAGVYLPIVLAAAATTFFVTGQLDRAIAVLIVACPCALVLAGPAAMVAAMTASSRLSILIKNAGFLETVAEIDTLILDKTGTVTAGALTLSELQTLEGHTSEELLRAAATCGHGSLHPISRSAVEEARKRGVDYDDSSKLTEYPGKGVEALAAGITYRLGRLSWLRAEGVEGDVEVQSSGPGAWVAREGQLLGYLALSDRTRQDAQDALLEMRSLGIQRLILLTGDKESVAAQVADQLGFDQYVAEVLPEQKLALVREEQAAGRRVMMVGDGVNDALALSGADVGVAIGARINEVTLGGADVALMSNRLDRLPVMMRLADRVRGIVASNALLGSGFSMFMIGLASAGIITPLMGAFLHNAGALFVIMNSSRLLHFHEEAGAVDELDADVLGLQVHQPAQAQLRMAPAS